MSNQDRDNSGGFVFDGGQHTFSGPMAAGSNSQAVQHGDSASQPSPPRQRTPDTVSAGESRLATAVVVTAIEEEFRAVAEHLSAPFDEHTEKDTLYKIGFLRGQRQDWRVALAQAGPGNVGAGVHLERARSAFAPDVILFVGVAGGLKDVRLGDVVVADAIYDYESAKELENSYQPRMKTASPSHRCVQRAMDVARSDEWQQRVRTVLPPDMPRPRALVKPLAAGGKLVAHDQALTRQRLRAYCGDATAVEMEGYGFLQSAYMSAGVDALVVRGISDLLTGKDERNDAYWQPVAARTAAAFACEFLDTFALSGGR
ncbi:5'-methylthioadenosine/S-adenosylhomocysteine nucleosidase family protein [Salinactinospora qingdaonensis]|uniref:5'-methylthioadenosine/S-adenosylhomocysteine nucleosidase n=1 Tax=Salinactinospora qingdaonensis TaxID=702744 RepID=A0ABP7G9J7_9ACTN